MKVSALVLHVALLGGCHYDWGVGPRDEGPDAGGVDASAADASADATTFDVGADRAVLDSEIGDGGDACKFLLAQVGIAFAADGGTIEYCGPTDSCPGTITDECGCQHSVVNADSQDVKNYVAAVKAYEDAGCHPTDCPKCGNPSHVCLNAASLCF